MATMRAPVGMQPCQHQAEGYDSKAHTRCPAVSAAYAKPFQTRNNSKSLEEFHGSEVCGNGGTRQEVQERGSTLYMASLFFSLSFWDITHKLLLLKPDRNCYYDTIEDLVTF